jgi:AcrR family transcriptional regulator
MPPGTTEARPPGRPRSAEADAAITRATLEVFVEEGFERLSMERIADRAGVGKATLYRRAGSKEELLVQAYARVRPPGPPDDSGSLEGDLMALARGQRKRSRELGGSIVARMIAAALSNDQLHRLYVERTIEPFRELFAEFLRRAIARGEVRDDIDIDSATDLLHGAIVYRLILDGGDPDDLPAFIRTVLPTALEGLRAR